jgi:Fur family zinc uptake transcriptional regulator
MDKLRGRYEGNVAPPTVYRALDFLQEYGLVHRLATLNAYIGCSQLHQRDHQPSFFICKECNKAMEVNTPRVTQAIREIASARQFSANTGGAVEVIGICNHCARNTRPQHQKDLLNV